MFRRGFANDSYPRLLCLAAELAEGVPFEHLGGLPVAEEPMKLLASFVVAAAACCSLVAAKSLSGSRPNVRLRRGLFAVCDCALLNDRCERRS
jgi:hypothetical protein